MTNDTTQDYAAQLADRQAIHDCLYRHALGTDTLDAEMWKDTYWPDADEEHGWYMGNAHRFVDETLISLPKDMDVTWHQIGNVLVELDGQKARVVSYYYAYCRMIGPNGARSDSFSGGRYVDRFEKRYGVWKIRYRITKADWVRFEDGTFPWGTEVFKGYVPKLGTRDHDDPARVMLGRASSATPITGSTISPPW